ncbi:ATP-dependent nuclease [Marinobacter sp. F4206]|uniref:ATP-dependent nuclease n=1 Tax=Marinobacter sp. F4206 TaxID=2861777 RepID=UPI001C5CEB8D|nr:AAA family ATPase [Marinobacter sp. F4206]MBW4935930.1 AAA family ATPase [Marinobacter sp. F4206]
MQIQELVNNAKFTVLLGKNGSGKSTLLRKIDSSGNFSTKYITPERGGTLKYEPGVEHNISNNPNWLRDTRRKNRTENFRQQSTAQFRNLEVMVLREIEKDLSKRKDENYTFDTTINYINELLPNINLKRSDRGFEISNDQDEAVDENNISSGESELIALSIEVLVFSRSTQDNKVLLLDEPDVHLHPDLQHKFVEFVEKIATEFNFRVVLATHSTAIVGAFKEGADLQIVPITEKNQNEFSFFKYDPVCHEILPVFGAHPLSSHFNKTPILLVEGEDDKRVFEQIARSSQGAIRYYPCVVGSVDEMNKWENWLNTFLPSIYDDPKAFSIRDLDDSSQSDINDIGFVRRTRLNCYAIENILLTNECLLKHGYNPEDFCLKIGQWVDLNPEHQTTKTLINLRDNFDQRRTRKIKDVRNVILALLGTAKPWEVLVGQLIATELQASGTDENSLRTYLGDKVVETLFS